MASHFKTEWLQKEKIRNFGATKIYPENHELDILSIELEDDAVDFISKTENFRGFMLNSTKFWNGMESSF